MTSVTRQRAHNRNRRARPAAVQLTCPDCGTTVHTVTGDEAPGADWMTNSARASVRAYSSPRGPSPDPVAAWLEDGYVFTCAHPRSQTSRAPFELALPAEDVVRLIGSAQLDGERVAVLRPMPFVPSVPPDRVT